MRVLFVDDEPHILEGIERMLFHLNDTWEIDCVQSGQEALTALEQKSYDVIVTDMKMPGMDGATLLRKVHHRFPDTVRIVLSGEAEAEAILETVPVAHRFLSKPCKAEELEETIQRTFNLRAHLQKEEIRKAIGQIKSLPSAPLLYIQLTKELRKPNVHVSQVAEIIQQDTGMSAKLLQVVNSAFFGFAASIADVQEAVARLGFQTIKSLALMAGAFNTPSALKKIDGFSLDELQRHSLYSASLAKRLLTDQVEKDYAVTAALLHDLGKLVLASQMPEQLAAVLEIVRSDGRPLIEVEKQIIGASHAQIGGCLLGLWGVPEEIVEAVTYHHEPKLVPQKTGFGVLGAVYVANCLSNGDELDTSYLVEVGVSDRIEGWLKIVEELQCQQMETYQT